MQRLARALVPFYALTMAAVSVSGCQCHHGPGTGDSFAVIEVKWTDKDGNAHADRDATYDFGPAFVGDRVAKQMHIRNGGLSTLVLDSLVQASGVDVTIGTEMK